MYKICFLPINHVNKWNEKKIVGYYHVLYDSADKLIPQYSVIDHIDTTIAYENNSNKRIYLHSSCGKQVTDCKSEGCANQQHTSLKIAKMSPIKWIPSKNDGSILQILNEAFVTLRNITDHKVLATLHYNEPDVKIRYIHLKCEVCGKNSYKYNEH